MTAPNILFFTQTYDGEGHYENAILDSREKAIQETTKTLRARAERDMMRTPEDKWGWSEAGEIKAYLVNRVYSTSAEENSGKTCEYTLMVTYCIRRDRENPDKLNLSYTVTETEDKNLGVKKLSDFIGSPPASTGE